MRIIQRIALAVLAVAAALFPTAPASAAADSTYNVWLWNVAGEKLQRVLQAVEMLQIDRV